jgi:signal transduction histidine kinase
VLNALKHANARGIEVRLTYSPTALMLDIRDDGRGISPGATEAAAVDGHLGISGMRDRAKRAAGTIDIVGEPTCGTTVRLSLPVE